MARYTDEIPSTAAIGGHPIHPMLIPFPIAFLVGALAADLAYWSTDDFFWARLARWLVGAGLVTGALAAVFGLVDFLTRHRIRQFSSAWIHFLGNAVVLVLSLISLLLRLDDPADAVLPWGLVLSAAVALILLVTGWLGGELSYRHKVGVVPDTPGHAPDDSTPRGPGVIR